MLMLLFYLQRTYCGSKSTVEVRKNGGLEGNVGRIKCRLSIANVCAMDSEGSYQTFTTEV
jgi:hypothetical protein